VIGKDLSDFPGLGNDLILAAIRFDRKDVVQWLLEKGVDINGVPYHRAAETAVRSGNMSLVRFLMKRGVAINLNPRNESGYVPIEAASECGQEEMVELLIEHGEYY
jgi:ankyrin repeat protein